MNYSFYVVDTETTGLSIKNDIIELSLLRLKDDVQKTWSIKPINSENIDQGALRVNGHKLDDLLHKTKEGRDNYLDANKVIIDVENWLSEDGFPAEKRFLIAHNIGFDKNMLESLWDKCNSKDSFPFGRRVLDTMIIALTIDYIDSNFSEGYSLANLAKKYGIKNDKAHSAASDTVTAKQIFNKQIEELRKRMNIK